MKKGLIALMCITVLVGMPACKKRDKAPKKTERPVKAKKPAAPKKPAKSMKTKK